MRATRSSANLRPNSRTARPRPRRLRRVSPTSSGNSIRSRRRARWSMMRSRTSWAPSSIWRPMAVRGCTAACSASAPSGRRARMQNPKHRPARSRPPGSARRWLTNSRPSAGRSWQPMSPRMPGSRSISRYS